MSYKIFQIDAFTNQAFSGNPAAVCLLPEAREPQWMQQVAAEMNLSETAFIVRKDDVFDLRWFTPITEVDLCGHATLASAHLLWEERESSAGIPIVFETKSGLLTANQKETGIEIDLPALPEKPVSAPRELLEALGVEACYVGKNRFDFLVEVATEEVLRAIKPDFLRLSNIPVRGVIVTAKSTDPNVDFVSRFFSPRYGINEDPVTGSAHCCLGPYWQKCLGKNEMVARQLSARGGILHVRPKGSRVFLKGEAVTVMRGTLL